MPKWLDDLIDVGGTIIEWSEQDKALRTNAEVARYNRIVDRARLGLYLKQNEKDQRRSIRALSEAWWRGDLSRRGVVLTTLEAENERFRRSYIERAAREEASEIQEIARREGDVATVRRLADQAGLRGEAATDRALGQLLGTESRQESRVYRAGQELRRRQLVQVGRSEGAFRRDVAAQRGVLRARRGELAARAEALAETGGAGLRSFAARERAIRGGVAIAREERLEAGYRAVGQAVADTAARGVRGSFSATALAQEGQSMARDLAMQEFEKDVALEDLAYRRKDLVHRVGVEQAQLVRAGAELAADETGLEGQSVTQEAQFATSRQEIRVSGLEAEAGKAVGGAQRAVRRAEIDARAGTRHLRSRVVYWTGEAAQARARSQVAEGERRKYRGLVEVRDSRAREGATELRQRQEQFAGVQAETARQDAVAEQDMQGRYRAFAEWQLERLPGLPDYEGMRTGAALGALLESMR